MFRIRIDTDRSKVVIHARATGHHFQTSISGLSGRIVLNQANLEESRGRLYLPMSQLDAGNFLRTAQAKRFLNPSRYPETLFDLAFLKMHADATLEGAMEREEEMEFEVGGKVSYRSRVAHITAKGRGTLSKNGDLRAHCQFKLDLRTLQIEPPRFLFLKINPEVEIEVELFGDQGQAHSYPAIDSRK